MDKKYLLKKENSMKKRFLLIAIIMIASLILTACGPTETEAPDVGETEAVEETEAVVEETEEVVEETEEVVEETEEVVGPTATIRIWADEQRAPVLSDLADDFLAEYGVELVVENISGIRDQFSVAAPAGEGPDIIIVPHDQAAALVASGLVAPIDLGEKAAEFAPEALEAFTYSGELFGMPYATENLGFFYNADIVEEPPTTWQGVYDMSQELIDAGTVQYGIVLAGTSYDAYPWMTSQGGYIFGLDENGDYDPSDVGVGNEGMIAFGEMAKQWADDGILSDNTDNTTAKAMFLNGEVAFFMNGPWELTNLREAGMNYGIAKFPDGGVPFLGVQGFLINAFSENILLAQAFLTEYVATEETMLAFVENDPRVPAYLPALANLEDADLAAIAAAGEGAQPMPAIPEMGKVWGDWGNALTFILNGEKTPEEAYTFAQDAIVAAIASDTEGMVNLPGSWQSTVSDCEWDPACAATAMEMGDDGLYYATFTIPAGDYEIKVALDGGWDTNYGVDGLAGGDNILFSVETEGDVTFVYDPETHLLEINQE
jgi:arabinogalactan oligomer / maltooligosaccharide transport system substrate-binding protein